jgi:hypothetical protein
VDEPPAAPAPAPTAATTAPELHECNVDLLDDAVQRWTMEMKTDVMRNALTIHPLPDADGDGKPEHMVFAESQCGTSGNCPRVLYLSKNGCSFAGAFWAEWESERVLPEVHHGVHDLSIYLKDGCAGLEGTVVRMAWNGTRYEQTKRIKCTCPDRRPNFARDPACP